MTIINPSVTNVEKSDHYIAIVLDSPSKLGVAIEHSAFVKAVRDSACGNIGNNHYFLRHGAEATFIHGQRKSCLRKARCCTIKKDIVKTDILLRLYRGNFVNLFVTYHLHLSSLQLQVSVMGVPVLNKLQIVHWVQTVFLKSPKNPLFSTPVNIQIHCF